jgi:hypothetical protein
MTGIVHARSSNGQCIFNPLAEITITIIKHESIQQRPKLFNSRVVNDVKQLLISSKYWGFFGIQIVKDYIYILHV